MVITPLQLWKDYDRRILPLAESRISCFEKDGVKTSFIYFNGEASSDGVTRIYAKLVEPTEKTNRAVLVMDEIDCGVDMFDCSPYISRGFAVLVVDYAGSNPSLSRFTIYPRTLSRGNAFDYPEYINSLGDTVKHSSRYIWTTNAMRGITLLESRGYTAVAMLGVGDGGHQVYKAAYFPGNLVCAAVKYAGTLAKDSDEPDENELAFKTSLNNLNYIPQEKCPLFMQLTSNEQNSSLDEMNDLFAATENDGKLLAISPRSEKMIDTAQKYNIPKFFSSVFNGEKLPKTPSVSFKGSEKSLYIEVSADTELKIESASLYVAYSQKLSAYRNWHNRPLEKIGEGDYLSKIPVYAADAPVYAFVNILYENGLIVSSKVISVIPHTYGVPSIPAPVVRRLYDVDMGTSEWMILWGEGSKSQKDETIGMENGPFDIAGVTSSTNSLATFTIEESRFQSNFDSVLQLIIYSPEPQTLTFAVRTQSGNSKYYCMKEISPIDNWTKFSLAAQDFRSPDGILQNLSSIITFEIHGESKFLINSVLWV